MDLQTLKITLCTDNDNLSREDEKKMEMLTRQGNELYGDMYWVELTLVSLGKQGSSSREEQQRK